MDIFQVNDSRIFNAYRRIKAIFSGDSHEPVQLGPFGDDSCPPKKVKGVKCPTSTDAIHVVLGYFNRDPKALPGEKRLFSVKDDGNESFYIYWKKDGTVEMGGNSNFAVKYNELATEYGKLKKSHDDLVIAFNSHMHPTAALGSPSPPTPVPNIIPAASDSSDISKAKNDNIKTI